MTAWLPRRAGLVSAWRFTTAAGSKVWSHLKDMLRRPWVRYLLGAAILVFAWSSGVLSGLWWFVSGHWPPEARVYLEPPQVYTRERLVNDRFREINWLEQRLDNPVSDMADWPSARLRDSRRTVLAAGEAADVPTDAGPEPETEPLALDQSQVFSRALARRLAVRSEIMNTRLDDAHDLQGATLYRLNFDVSLVPKPEARGFGFVAIDVHAPTDCGADDDRGPCRNGELETEWMGRLLEEHRGLLQAWELDLQRFLARVFEDRRMNLGALEQDPFAGSRKEGMAFDWYVKARTVELWLGLLAGAIVPGDCPEEIRRDQGRDLSSEWSCNPLRRRDQVRYWLGLPGSRDTLPGDLNPGFQRKFAQAIRRYAEALREDREKAELRRFLREYAAGLVKGPSKNKGAGAGDPGSINAKPPTVLGHTTQQACGAGQSRDTEPDATDSGMPVADENIALSCLLKQEGINIDPVSLDLLLSTSDESAAADGGQGIAPGPLNRQIRASVGCQRRGFILLPDKTTSVRCPQPADPVVTNLAGLVQLAGVVRSFYHSLVEHDSGTLSVGLDRYGTHCTEAASPEQCKLGRLSQALSTCLPYMSPDDAEKIALSKGPMQHTANFEPDSQGYEVDRSCLEALVDQPILHQLEACWQARANRETGTGPTSAPSDTVDRDACVEDLLPEARVERVLGILDSLRDRAREQGPTLIQRWMAEFFVDRLKRSDIPGYHPSPPIDRFFDVQASGCELGRCEIMLARKRWLSRDDLEDVREELRVLRPDWDADGDSQVLRRLLPNTWRQCIGREDKRRVRCERLLQAAHRAAIPPDRKTLISHNAESGAIRYERQLQCEFNRLRARRWWEGWPDRGDSCRKDSTPDPRRMLTGTDIAIVQDYIQSVTALVLKHRLDTFGGNVLVYAVEPRIKNRVDRTSSESKLFLGGGAALPEPLADLDVRLGREAEASHDRLDAPPTVIGFGQLRGRDGSGRQASFGWTFLPDRPDGTHGATTHTLAAVLSVPSWWTQLQLTVRQCWGRRGSLSDALLRDPYRAEARCTGTDHQYGLAPAGRVSYTVDLPETTDRITEVFDFEVIKVPNIKQDPTEDLATLEAGRPGAITLEGDRLWRGTMVTLGGQRADTITVLPDMKGVVARFDCVQPPPGARHFTKFETMNKETPERFPANWPSRSKVMVWTSQGNVPANAEIYPFRQRLPDELPCWLTERERRAAEERLQRASESGESQPAMIRETVKMDYASDRGGGWTRVTTTESGDGLLPESEIAP